MPLPAPVQELWSVWREIEGHAGRPVMVNLCGPAGEQREALKQLLLQGSQRPGSLRVQELGPEAPSEADIHLVLLDPAFGPTTSQLALLRRLDPKDLLIVLLGGDERQFESRRREVATSVGVRADQVLTALTLSELRNRLAQRLITLFEDDMVPLARQFPFLREMAANEELKGTSQQNALVGVIPVPGADMPVMTANQIKMILRLAAIYDQPMTYDRAKEVLAVVGGAFAMRTVARQLAKFVPGPGWIVGGAMGYAGTMAMGKAAIEYFRHGTEGAPPPARPTRPAASPTVIDAEATPVEHSES